jgi:hypothetical protein
MRFATMPIALPDDDDAICGMKGGAQEPGAPVYNILTFSDAMLMALGTAVQSTRESLELPDAPGEELSAEDQEHAQRLIDALAMWQEALERLRDGRMQWYDQIPVTPLNRRTLN